MLSPAGSCKVVLASRCSRLELPSYQCPPGTTLFVFHGINMGLHLPLTGSARRRGSLPYLLLLPVLFPAALGWLAAYFLPTSSAALALPTLTTAGV